MINCWLVGNAVEGGQGGEGGPNVIGGTYFSPGSGGGGGPAEGGAFFSVSGAPSEFDNCTFSANRAVGGLGGKGGTNIASAISPAGTGGQGGYSQAGAVQSDSGMVTFTACTLSENRSIGGQGGTGGDNIDGGPGGTGGNGNSGAGGAYADFSGGSFDSCTIVSNSAVGGPGGLGGNGGTTGADGSASFGDAGALIGYTFSCFNGTIANTILADNFASTSYPNFWMAFQDMGFNFIGSDDCGCCPWMPSSQVGGKPPIHPLLGPLAQNGGGMPTHATRLTSPVTDQGSSLLPTDERGAPRVYDWPLIPNAPGGNGADIGAFELGSTDLGAAIVSNNIVLSWPAYYGDFVLQSAANLQGSNVWSNVPGTPVVISNQFVFTNATSSTSQFYRLVNQ